MPNLRQTIARAPTPSPTAADVVRRAVAWARRAGTAGRAEAASALARAYLHADLTAELRAVCAVALAVFADDGQVEVRRALAEAFAGARGAPRALVLALAGDRSEVALPLLARSPLLTDADLVDCVAAGDEAAQCAVARRAGLGAGPAAALAEVGAREAALALIENPGAALASKPLGRLVERFGGDAGIREALLGRQNLPACVAAEIIIAAPGPIEGPAASGVGLRDACGAALAALAARCPDGEMPELVRTLRARGALTLALLLRSLLGGKRALFASALAELASLRAARVAALLRDPRGKPFAAAAARAGLPARALPVFRAALARLAGSEAGPHSGVRPALVAAAIAACEAENDPALAPFLSFLERLAAEAADAWKTLPPGLDFRPANDDPTADAKADPCAAPSLGAALPDGAPDAAPPVELPADWILALDAA